MTATIVGIKRLNFTDRGTGEVIDREMYYLTIPGEDMEGQEVEKMSHDITRHGKPPKRAVGDTMEVEYNKNGRIRVALQ